jgi:hypothetical protein
VTLKIEHGMATTWVRCPVHDGYHVGISDDGHLLGRCPECAAEAARAIAFLEAMDRL